MIACDAQVRVLFVEFVHDDPHDQHRSELYPFIQGYLRAQGVTTAWVYLEGGAARRPTHPYVVEPTEGQGRQLLTLVEDFEPRFVVLNERCEDGLIAALGTALGEDLGAETNESLVLQPPHALLRSPSVEQIKRIFGLSRGLSGDRPGGDADELSEQPCAELADPDYGSRPLDPEAPPLDRLARALAFGRANLLLASPSLTPIRSGWRRSFSNVF